jgi:triacylglycerol lipase
VPLLSSIVSFLDSPGYSNLTSHYLNIHFNPSTPDSPNVKYWSIGAHTKGMSFFHPLWLPKLILDGNQEKLQKQGIDSLGNDGLVTVDSAKWGEFLGVLEGCDHWDIRGAGGLSAHIDEGNEKTDMGGSGENKWGWSDWQRFLGAWDQDKTRRNAKTDSATIEPSTEHEKRLERAKAVRTLEDSDAKHKMVDEAKGHSGAKDGSGSFTMDNLLDWVVENVPGVGAVKVPLKSVVERTAAIASSNKKVPNGEKVEEQVKPPRFDLERFYVALSRKLYDEGL